MTEKLLDKIIPEIVIKWCGLQLVTDAETEQKISSLECNSLYYRQLCSAHSETVVEIVTKNCHAHGGQTPPNPHSLCHCIYTIAYDGFGVPGFYKVGLCILVVLIPIKYSFIQSFICFIPRHWLENHINTCMCMWIKSYNIINVVTLWSLWFGPIGRHPTSGHKLTVSGYIIDIVNDSL